LPGASASQKGESDETAFCGTYNPDCVIDMTSIVTAPPEGVPDPAPREPRPSGEVFLPVTDDPPPQTFELGLRWA
jgi:hypothetical protein